MQWHRHVHRHKYGYIDIGTDMTSDMDIATDMGIDIDTSLDLVIGIDIDIDAERI